MLLHSKVRRWHVAVFLLGLSLVVGTWSKTWAGNTLLSRGNNVGGISISTAGILAAAKVENLERWREMRAKAMQPVPENLQAFNPLRKVSLRRLEEAIRKHRSEEFVPLPDYVSYLAGLQSIHYVFVYPEEHDIVLVGPGEGWRMDKMGNVVGLTTGRPVLLLDDFLVALRSAATARMTGIQCSIDPTPEGLVNVKKYVSKLKTIGNAAETMQNIEEALGPQVVTVDGVPPESHFARVMVAADFRMKRLGMKFEPAPIDGLPSFLDMLSGQGRGVSNLLPRWWLAPKAEPLLVSPDGLSYELRGLGVECKTEEDFVATDGKKKATGKSGTIAQRWADLFTEKYDELSQVDAIFGELRNLIDLAVVAALIEKEGLFEKAGFTAENLTQEEPFETFSAAKRVDSRATILKKGRNYIISASGGVQMYPAHIAAETEQSETLAPVRKKSHVTGDAWWSN